MEHLLASLWSCLHVCVVLSCVLGESISDFCDYMWICSCIVDCLMELSVFTVAKDAGRKEEPPPTLCISSQGKDKQLQPSSTGTFLSPNRIILDSCHATDWIHSWRNKLQLKGATLTRPFPPPNTVHAVLGPPQSSKHKNLPYNSVFFLFLLLISILLYFMPKRGNRKEIKWKA